jgi:hypothetical protein
VRRHFYLPGILDHFIHLGMRAQEAVTERHGVRAWLGSLLGALCKMFHADLHDLALWGSLGCRFRVLFGHFISPLAKQTEGTGYKAILSIGGTQSKL